MGSINSLSAGGCSGKEGGADGTQAQARIGGVLGDYIEEQLNHSAGAGGSSGAGAAARRGTGEGTGSSGMHGGGSSVPSSGFSGSSMAGGSGAGPGGSSGHGVWPASMAGAVQGKPDLLRAAMHHHHPSLPAFVEREGVRGEVVQPPLGYRMPPHMPSSTSQPSISSPGAVAGAEKQGVQGGPAAFGAEVLGVVAHVGQAGGWAAATRHERVSMDSGVQEERRTKEQNVMALMASDPLVTYRH